MIINTINDKIKAAMLAKDAVSLATLRALKAAIATASQSKGRANPDVDDLEILTIVRKQIKQREDSIEQFVKGQRFDLAANERDEKLVLESFLPQQMSQDELDNLVNAVIVEFNATTKKDMGRVIKEVVSRANGQADNQSISKTVGQKLN